MEQGDAVAPSAYERGIETVREMWGDAPIEALEEMSTEFSRDIHRLVIASCFGECWSEGTLSPQHRSLITIAIIAALGKTEETEFHFRMALENGCTPGELRELGKHLAAYAGAPAGMQFARLGDRVLAERRQ